MATRQSHITFKPMKHDALIAVHQLHREKRSQDVQRDFIEMIDADFREFTGFKRVAVHHIVLPPGARTSLPHSESLEEEAVIVLSGTPDLWLDGWITPLKTFDAVGFPAGTGLNHTFINNSREDAVMLVMGERTKRENLCHFPLHREKRGEENSIWWELPEKALGPHSGLPGVVSKEQIAQQRPACVKNILDLPVAPFFHYPGDRETFGEGRRLTSELGLKFLGLWFEELPPGKRSSWPHAHRMEEEFAFIVEGEADVWLDGEIYRASPGTAIAFRPGSGVSHCLINNSDRVVRYVMIGEAVDVPGEKIIYPLHELRNEYCARVKWIWNEDLPRLPMGAHNGKPNHPVAVNFYLAKSDQKTVLSLFERSRDYFLKVNRAEPSLETVQTEMSEGPANRTPTYLKEFLQIYLDDEPIGVVDLHKDHPTVGEVYIGLLLLADEYKGRGLGRKAYELIEHYVKHAYGSKGIRLGISNDNDVSGFWTKLGFLPNGKVYQHQGEAHVTHVTEYSKTIV